MVASRIVEDVRGESDLKVDAENGVIRGVKILGRVSKNGGRRYTDNAMADGVKHYEGVGVNVDHVGDEGHITRPFAHGFGELRNVTKTKDGVFGDLHFNRQHPLAGMVVEHAQRFANKFGLSHVALGQMAEDADGTPIVESLESVESVDIVSRPATNAGLFESEGGPRMANDTKSGAKKTTSAKKTLEAQKSNAHAAAFLKLFEEDAGMAAMADAPVEAAPDSSSEDQVKAAFRSMIIAAVDDSNLDMKATLAKIRDLLKSQEKLLGTSTATKPDAGGGDGAMATSESVKVDPEIAKMKAQLAIREAMEDADVAKGDLSEAQWKVLQRCQSKADAAELLESFALDKRAVSSVGVSPLFESQGGDDGEFDVKGLIERHKVR